MVVRGVACVAALFSRSDLPFDRFVNCHCSRCRKATGTAHAVNAVVGAGALRWRQGVDLVARYDLRTAHSFATAFCRRCGSHLPHMTRSGREAIIPAGALDGALDVSPSWHAHWEVPRQLVYPWRQAPDLRHLIGEATVTTQRMSALLFLGAGQLPVLWCYPGIRPPPQAHQPGRASAAAALSAMAGVSNRPKQVAPEPLMRASRQRGSAAQRRQHVVDHGIAQRAGWRLQVVARSTQPVRQ